VAIETIQAATGRTMTSANRSDAGKSRSDSSTHFRITNHRADDPVTVMIDRVAFPCMCRWAWVRFLYAIDGVHWIVAFAVHDVLAGSFAVSGIESEGM
jgi:hypothetical protein